MKRSWILLALILSTPLALANVVGVDAQNFNPTTSGLDFVTVHSSKTLAPGVTNFGLFFNYALNTLPNYEDATQTKFEPQDALTSMDLNMGIGLLNNWDIGISLPQVLNQTVDEDSTVFRGQFEQSGLNEIRLNSKYRVWDGTTQGLAIIGSVNFFLIEDYPFTGVNPGPTYNIEVAYDNTFGNWTWGVNAGYRIRNPGDPVGGTPPIPVDPFGNMIIGSAALSYYFANWDLKVIGEVFGSTPTEETRFSSDREISTGEVLLGLKWDVLHNVAAHFGAGTEILQGTSSPDVRVYAGVNVALGPLWGSTEPQLASSYVPDELPPQPEGTLDQKTFKYIDEEQAFLAPPPAAGAEETFLAKNILFEFNGTRVNPDFLPYLKNLADYLMKGGGFQQLVVFGHTDSVGSDAYNLDLSLRRAQAVKEAVASFLPPEHQGKLQFEGLGERYPIASNNNYQGRALNRRVEFFIKR